jgi:hypothetical protein
MTIVAGLCKVEQHQLAPASAVIVRNQVRIAQPNSD